MMPLKLMIEVVALFLGHPVFYLATKKLLRSKQPGTKGLKPFPRD